MESIFRPPAPLSLTGNVAENWKKFHQKFKYFLDATGKSSCTGKTKVAILLNLIGDDGLEVFNTFKFDDETDKSNLAVVIDKFEKHCAPLKNVVFERYKFFNVVQREGQTFDNFLTELQKAASTCEFVEEETLIRDRIVLGIRDKALQERMLREPNLTLKKGADYCRAAEASRQQAEALQDKGSVDFVKNKKDYKNKSQGKTEKTKLDKEYQCKKCAYTHKKGACPAFSKTCAICKEKDHFAKGCPNRKKRVNELEYVDPNNQIDTSDSDDGSVHSPPTSPLQGLYVCSLNTKNSQTNQVDSLSKRSWKEGISVEGQIVEFKLDTGAEINVLPLAVYNNLQAKPPMSQTKTLIQPYGVESNYIKPEGIVTLNCEIQAKSKAAIEFLIADVHAQPILGLEGCIKLNLIKRVHEVTKETDKSKFIKSNKDLFEGLGKLPGTHHIEVKSDVIPVANAPRRIPLSLLEKLKTTLKELEQNGIITAVDYPTDWVNSLLIVEKSSGDLRICLDPRVLNLAIRREHHMIPTADALIAKLVGKAVFTVLDLR